MSVDLAAYTSHISEDIREKALVYVGESADHTYDNTVYLT